MTAPPDHPLFFCLLMNSVILLLAISSGGRGDLGKTKIENVLFLGRSSLICFKYFHTHTHAFGLHHPSRLWSPATNTSATTIFFNSSKTTTKCNRRGLVELIHLGQIQPTLERKYPLVSSLMLTKSTFCQLAEIIWSTFALPNKMFYGECNSFQMQSV